MPNFPFNPEELEDRIRASIDRLLEKFCNICKLGYMKDFTLEKNEAWLRCPICGFCKEKTKN